jgi:hypothetical protein
MKLQYFLILVSTVSFFIPSTRALPIDILPKFTPRDVNILSLGDWGSASLGGYHLRNAESTAAAMSVYVEKYKPKLVLNTGDNFYYCGIQNTSVLKSVLTMFSCLVILVCLGIMLWVIMIMVLILQHS